MRLPEVLVFAVLLSWGGSGAFRSGAVRKKRRAATLPEEVLDTPHIPSFLSSGSITASYSLAFSFPGSSILLRPCPCLCFDFYYYYYFIFFFSVWWRKRLIVRVRAPWGVLAIEPAVRCRCKLQSSPL